MHESKDLKDFGLELINITYDKNNDIEYGYIKDNRIERTEDIIKKRKIYHLSSGRLCIKINTVPYYIDIDTYNNICHNHKNKMLCY